MARVGRLRLDEDGGAMTLCDVGRLTRSDFLTRWDGDLSMACYEDGGAMTMRDVGQVMLGRKANNSSMDIYYRKAQMPIDM